MRKEANEMFERLNRPDIVKVALDGTKLRNIFYGTEKTIGLESLLEDGFRKTQGYLRGDLEDAYTLMMRVDGMTTTPDDVKERIKWFQENIIKP